jgi:uncharacterized protein (TIGR01777 family)
VSAPRVWLVSGATGLVGRRLVRVLLRDGAVVRALTRDLKSASGRLDPKVVLVRWDGAFVPVDAVNGVEAVVHLAGEPVFGGRLTAGRRRLVYGSRVHSTRALVKAIGALRAEDRPRVLVCASAVGFYGSRGEEELDEAAEPGAGFLAELCRDWEAAALLAEEHGVRSVAMRIGIVLDREGGALAAMLRPFRLGLGGRLGSGRQWVPWIHADDLVALLRSAAGDPGYRGAVNAVAPEPVRNRELTRALAAQLGRPALLPAPAFALRAALGELARELLDSRRVVPKRALERGFAFRHATLESALAAELGAR